MRDTTVLQSYDLELAQKIIYDHITEYLDKKYLWNIDFVVNVLTSFGVTKYADDPAIKLDFWDQKVREITERVARYLMDEYRGPAEFGMLQRARYLYELACG